jgi:hypothetical protein
MEYVLFALRDSQQSTKARLGKLRHLDSLFFFLLLTALLSFQLLQHRQLREELQAHRPDYLLDELLQERIPQLEREVSELRGAVGEMSAIIHQALHENKVTLLPLSNLPSSWEDSSDCPCRPVMSYGKNHWRARQEENRGRGGTTK